MICEATQDDISWLLQLATDCYPAFDVISSEKWLRARMGHEALIIVKGEHSAALAIINVPFWTGERDCELQFVCARKSRFGAVELSNVLKYVNYIRKQRHCKRFYINSRLADLSSISTRIGAKLAGTSYVLED